MRELVAKRHNDSSRSPGMEDANPNSEIYLRFSNFLNPSCARVCLCLLVMYAFPVVLEAQSRTSSNDSIEVPAVSQTQPVSEYEFIIPEDIEAVDSGIDKISGPLQKLRDLPVAPTRGLHLVESALPFLGTAYRFGGTSPKTGFDCSGMVQHVYAKWGVKLPRTAELQFRKGVSVSFFDLQPGDLIFRANTYKRGISHVGIYIGHGQWVHAASRKQGVIVSNVPLFNAGQEPGARRFDLSKLPPVEGETTEYLASIAAIHSSLSPKTEMIASRAPLRVTFNRNRTLAYRGGAVQVRVCGDSGEIAHSGCTSFKIVQSSVSRMRKMKRCHLHKLPSGEAG